MIFLKLGGSLITDKTQDNRVRWEVVKRLAQEIAQWRADSITQSKAPLLIGHGSGSFGHAAAKKYGTRAGVRDAAGWRGFADVSVAALRLNRIVADALHEASVPVVSVPPSASVLCADGVIQHMDLNLIAVSLARGLVPLVMGDVAIDTVRGGTIVSTEEVFSYLAQHFPVQRVLLAGETEGVFERFEGLAGFEGLEGSQTFERSNLMNLRNLPNLPTPSLILPKITPANWDAIRAGIGGSRGADVTGGMAAKVRDMLTLVQAHPAMQIQIFSGLQPNALTRVLNSETLGTLIASR